LLEETPLGRIAVNSGALPAILPVHYRMLDGSIVFRTAPGMKLTAAACGAIVAFEIDHADLAARTGWSVLVLGEARRIDDPATLARAKALDLRPWFGSRDYYVQIEIGRLSGRRIVPA
jgi:nitroimidazol reductase NimA-like FMN-containing flavoprotein (pyridoxamine 5'-phosphate oxidase superfamily)